MELTDEQIESLEETIIAAAEGYYQFETEHDGALDAYTHLPYEGDWQYHNVDQIVVKMIKELFDITIPKDMVESFGEECLERIEWRFGHTFSCQPDQLGGFPIGEVECQIDSSNMPQWFIDLSEDDRKEVIKAMNYEFDYYFPDHGQRDMLHCYRQTDVTVDYYITPASLREAYSAAVRNQD